MFPFNSSQEVEFLRRENIFTTDGHSHYISAQNMTLDLTDDYPESKERISSDMAAIIFTACLLFVAAALMGSCYCAYFNAEPLRIMYNCLPCVTTDKRYQRRDRIEDDFLLNKNSELSMNNANNTTVMVGTSSTLSLQSHGNSGDSKRQDDDANKKLSVDLENRIVTIGDDCGFAVDTSKTNNLIPPLLFSVDSSNNFVPNSPKHTFGQRVYPSGILNNSSRHSSNSFSNEIACDNIYGVSSYPSRSNSARLINYHRSTSNNAIESNSSAAYASGNNISSRNLSSQVTIMKVNSTIITSSGTHDDLHISN